MALNPILINGKSQVYGGAIVKMSFSVEYNSPNEISVEVVSKTGDYTINEDRLSTERADKISIPFGSTYKHVYMLPISYEINKEPTGRILRINYVDCSKIYLDKHLVFLYKRHLYKSGFRTIVVGNALESVNGTYVPSTTQETTWSSGQAYEVKYKFSDLIAQIVSHKIPLSNKLLSYSVDSKLNLYRDFSGTLRDTLLAWGEELGLTFFWESFSDGQVNKLGYLTFIENSKAQANLEKIKRKVQDLENSCVVVSSSNSFSIDNCYANSSIINTSETEGGQERTQTKKLKVIPLNCFERNGQSTILKNIDDEFAKLDIRVFSEIRDGKPWSASPQTQDEKDLIDMLKAAAQGPEFYKSYVFIKLMIANPRANPSFSPTFIATGKAQGTIAVFTTPDSSTINFLGDGGSIVAGEDKYIRRNLLLERLYKFGTANKLKLAPLFCMGSGAADGLSELYNQDGLIIEPYVREKLADLGQNKDFKKNLGTDVENGLMIGAIENNEATKKLIDNTEEDPVFKSLKVLLKTCGKVFFHDRMITTKKMSNYEFVGNKDTEIGWEYGGLSIQDVGITSDIWNLESQKDFFKDLVEEDWRIPKNGDAPSWRSSPSVDQFYNVKVKDPALDYLSGEGYEDLISISTYLADVFKNFQDKTSRKTIEYLMGRRHNGIYANSISSVGYGLIQSAREEFDGQEIISYSSDLDLGVITVKKLVELEDNKKYGSNFIENYNLGTDQNANTLDIFLIYYTHDFYNYSINEKLKYMYIGYFEYPEYITYQTTSEQGISEEEYGLTTIPNLTNEKIAQIKIVDQTISEENLKEVGTNSATDAIIKMSEAYQKTNQLIPAYEATLELATFPESSLMPTIEEGLEGFSVSFGGDDMSVTLNLGNSKRTREKAENIFRLMYQNNNMNRTSKVISKVSKFTPEYKVYNRL